MTLSPVAPERLAAGLAARLVHDISGPASGVISGVDLYANEAELRQEALELTADSARALIDMLSFHQVAFAGGLGPQSGGRLAELASNPFRGRRATLEWALTLVEFGSLAAQATLIVAQIASGGLALGGTARLSGGGSTDGFDLRLDASGPRAALGPEVIAGLDGEPCGDGFAGRWAPAYYLRALVHGASGRLERGASEDRFWLTVALPEPAAAVL